MTTQTDRPCPTIEATRRAIIDHITADAIDAYETARRRLSTYADATDAFTEGGFTEFGMLIERRLSGARDYLVRVLLARSGYTADPDDGPEGRIRPTCGVIAGGKVYLASVTHEYVDHPEGDDPANCREPLMGLTVADRSAVVEMQLPDLDAAG